MIDSHNMNSLFDADVLGPDGAKIGTVKHLYVDPDGGHPLFVGVSTGLFGSGESFVPLRDADFDGEVLRVPYDKDTVKHAPRSDKDSTLSDAELDRIHDYYDEAGNDDEDDHSSDDETGRRRDDRDERRPQDGNGQRAEEGDTRRPGRERVRVRRYVVEERGDGSAPVVHGEATSTVYEEGTPTAHEEVTIERERSADGPQGDTRNP